MAVQILLDSSWLEQSFTVSPASQRKPLRRLGNAQWWAGWTIGPALLLELPC